MKIQLELLVILIISFSSSVNCKENCTPDPEAPSCVCSMPPDGKKIDLRSIAHNDETAAFTNIKGQNQDTYSYNPCYGFTDGACKNVAGCQNSGGKRSIGTQANADIEVDDKNLVSIAYVGGNGGRNMVVNLICKEGQKTPSLKFDSEAAKNQYVFTLTTECACPGACDGGSHPSGGGGQSKSHHSNISKIGVPGIVILSVFVILIIVYFVAGMIIMRVKYEKTGSDIIPNKGFWVALPFLVKDGCVFTCTPCLRYYQGRSRGYSNIK